MESMKRHGRSISSLMITFHALKYRNFRLFFIGQGISLIGTWMQQIAMSWLVYRLTGSAFILGVVGFSSQIPSFIFSPFAGVFADRWNKHKILIFTQTASMVQAVLLAILTLTGVINVWQIVILGIFLGCINALDVPARQSFIIHMVERKEVLGNAIALNSFMFNAARLIGPSIAGALIALAGEGICFFINGISFLAVIACLLAMDIKLQKIQVEKSYMLKGLKEGISYIAGFAPIKYILILLSIISFMGMSYMVLMPVFAKNILHGGPSTLGLLMSSVGVGAIIGTIFLASQKKMLKIGNIIPISSSIFAVGLIFFALSRILWISCTLLVVTGFGFMVQMASGNTVLQTISEDDKRGRVMSFYAMAFMGMMPFGSLFAGSMAKYAGPTNALIIGGSVCLVASIVFATKIPKLKAIAHPIYEKIEILPGVMTGADNVAELNISSK